MRKNAPKTPAHINDPLILSEADSTQGTVKSQAREMHYAQKIQRALNPVEPFPGRHISIKTKLIGASAHARGLSKKILCDILMKLITELVFALTTRKPDIE